MLGKSTPQLFSNFSSVEKLQDALLLKRDARNFSKLVLEKEFYSKHAILR
jgi:hypothetical protein